MQVYEANMVDAVVDTMQEELLFRLGIALCSSDQYRLSLLLRRLNPYPSQCVKIPLDHVTMRVLGE